MKTQFIKVQIIYFGSMFDRNGEISSSKSRTQSSSFFFSTQTSWERRLYGWHFFKPNSIRCSKQNLEKTCLVKHTRTKLATALPVSFN